MPDSSPILALPFLQPSQAQKHVTHNEALQRLDLLVQMRVAAFGALTPPALPEAGEIHALGPAPTGAWAGHGNSLAAWTGDGWSFFDPHPGWRAWGLAESELRLWDGAAWVLPAMARDNLAGLGINTGADAVNRLSVRAAATLLSHEGAGHQLKLNKAAPGDTASLLFQSDWTGHAEMGLAGDTDFAIKVSADGTTWTEALRIGAANGRASGAAVQSSKTDVTPGRLMRADYGYSRGNILGSVAQSGGTPTGAVIERGSNANGEYVRFADGTQICRARMLGIDITTAIGAVFRSTQFDWIFPAAFSLGTINGPQVWGSVLSQSGLQVTSPYGGRTTQASDMRAFSALNVTGAEIQLVAIGRWY